MGTLIKWLFGLILVLVLLIAAAVVILPMVVDPNDYKPQIVEAAKQHTGRDLAIDEDLRLSVFPWLGIETGGVRLGNATGFEAASFAEIEQVGLKVKLAPLLSSRVEVDTLVVKGLRLNLEKDASGKTNWDDLASIGEKSGSEEQATAPEETDGASMTLSVQGIQIEDANISWDDRQAGQTYLLEGVRLVTGALAPGSTVPVESNVTFTSNRPRMVLKADLNAAVSTDAALKVFNVAGLVLELDAIGEGLPKDGAQLTLKTDLVADTVADTLKLDNLAISGPAMAARGEVAVKAMQSNPAVSGKLRIAETNPKTLASMFAVPIVTADPVALTRASGELAFGFADGALKLDPLTVMLDDSNLNGHVHVLDMAGPTVRTKLTLDQIDVDRYLAPSAPADPVAQEKTGGTDSKASADATRAPAKASAEDPFKALRSLDLVGDFEIGQLTANKARMSNVKTRIVSKRGVLNVDPMSANLYEGTFNGSVTLNASGKTPKIAAKKRLSNIQIGSLLKDVVGEDRLLGRGELNLDVSVVGISEREVRQSLNGTSSFAFKNGAFKGVNIAQLIRQGRGALGLGGGNAPTDQPNQTDFSELTGSMKITNGVIKNQDLAAKSPLLRIDGNGQVDLPKDEIDYLIVTELVGSLEGQGGKSRGELAGVPIPVRVSGPLSNPKYRPDLEAALNAKAKAELEAKKDELKAKAREKVEEKVKGKVGDALKGLFK